MAVRRIMDRFQTEGVDEELPFTGSTGATTNTDNQICINKPLVNIRSLSGNRK